MDYARTVLMYTGPLASLQGSDWNEVPPEQYLQADRLRCRLHAFGVEHGDWEPRNISSRDKNVASAVLI